MPGLEAMLTAGSPASDARDWNRRAGWVGAWSVVVVAGAAEKLAHITRATTAVTAAARSRTTKNMSSVFPRSFLLHAVATTSRYALARGLLRRSSIRRSGTSHISATTT
jgi:hypothetical protein